MILISKACIHKFELNRKTVLTLDYFYSTIQSLIYAIPFHFSGNRNWSLPVYETAKIRKNLFWRKTKNN